MKKVLFFILLFSVLCSGRCFSQSITAADIERTQVILQKEEAFKQVINKPEVFYIKTIALEGVTLLSEGHLNGIISAFKKRWLSEEDILGILASIKIVYQQNGFTNQPGKILFKIEKYILKIRVEELPQQNKNVK